MEGIMNAYILFTRQEALKCLNISRHRLDGLLEDGVIAPDKVIYHRGGLGKSYYFSRETLIKASRVISMQNYKTNKKR